KVAVAETGGVTIRRRHSQIRVFFALHGKQARVEVRGTRVDRQEGNAGRQIAHRLYRQAVVDLLRQIALFQVWQQVRRPTPAWRVWLRTRPRWDTIDLLGFGTDETDRGPNKHGFVIDIARWKGAMVIGVEMQGETDLLEIVLAAEPTGGLPRLL